MTGYDPFSYGQVRMGGGDPAAADAPDDLLFARPANGPAPDACWNGPAEFRDGPAADAEGEFGDLLATPPPRPMPAPAPAPAPHKARPAAVPRPAMPATGMPVADKMRPPVATVARAASSTAVPASSPAQASSVTAPLRRPLRPEASATLRLAGLVVPPFVFVAGGTAAAWLWAFEQNQVLGGIVAGLSLVAAAFAWVFLRR